VASQKNYSIDIFDGRREYGYKEKAFARWREDKGGQVY
jgi:hypothetical protein